MKKHIYNKVYGAALLTTLLLAAAACTNETPLADNGQDPDNTKPEAGTLTTVTVSQDAGAQTRLEYTEDGNMMRVAWKEGDVIYIGKMPATKAENTEETLTQAGFKKFVCETINGNQATFKAGQGLTGISSGTKLYAFYANEKNSYIHHNVSSISFMNFLTKQNTNEKYYLSSPSTFSSQRQIANNDKGHIRNYDFMYASTDYQENQTPSFNFKHGVSLIKFVLQMPKGAIGKSMKKLEFKYQYSACGNDLTLNSLELKAITLHTSSSPVTLLLGENESGFQCDTSTGTPTLTAYLVYDYIIKDKEITVTVTDTDNATYSAKLTSNKVDRGKFYTAELTLNQD